MKLRAKRKRAQRRWLEHNGYQVSKHHKTNAELDLLYQLALNRLAKLYGKNVPEAHNLIHMEAEYLANTHARSQIKQDFED